MKWWIWAVGGAAVGLIAWFYLFGKKDNRAEILEKARAAKAAKALTETANEGSDPVDTQ